MKDLAGREFGLYYKGVALQPRQISPQMRYPNLAKEALITSRKRGNPENRFWAKIVDILCLLPLLIFLSWAFPNLVLPASLLYWIWVDSMGRGQSPGKWLLGLHTIDVHRGEKTKIYNGFVRNLPFALLTAALFKTGFLWGLVGLVSVALLLLESYFVFTLRSGIRVGDVLGYTRVFDFKDIHTQFIEQFLKKEENT